MNVYLDANGGVPLSPAALRAIERAGKCTNPSNTNALAGREAEKEYDSACEKLKKLLVDKPDEWEIINTSGASEGIVTCLVSLSGSFPTLVTNGAHPVVEETMKRYELKNVSCDHTKEGVMAAMKTSSYSGLFITQSISLTGELVDVSEMVKAFKKHQSGTPIIVDSTQVIGKMPKPVIGLDVDAIIFSSHKFGGAKGHGAVLIRSDGPLMALWKPLIPGSQQNGMRGGTLNVMGVSSAADALEEVMEGIEKKHEKMGITVGKVVEELKKKDLPRVKILAPLDGKKYVMNTILISLPFCSRVFAKRLSEKGYDVGTGSACQTNVVIHTGERYPYQIRISLSCGCDLNVSFFVDTFSDVYEETRKRWKEKLEEAISE